MLIAGHTREKLSVRDVVLATFVSLPCSARFGWLMDGGVVSGKQ